MRSFMISAFVVLASSLAAFAASVDVGPIKEKEPPSIKELVVPKSDTGIDAVRLRATVSGEVGEHGKSKVYVLVNPLSNPETRNLWWVQDTVTIRDGKFSCPSQFGEGSQGEGEHFAIVALATDKNFDVGQQVNGLPKAQAYSKLKIVKRK